MVSEQRLVTCPLSSNNLCECICLSSRQNGFNFKMPICVKVLVYGLVRTVAVYAVDLLRVPVMTAWIERELSRFTERTLMMFQNLVGVASTTLTTVASVAVFFLTSGLVFGA